MYFNGEYLLHYDAWLILCTGNRGTGKSFYWKKYCIKRYINEKRKFIYIRRTQADIDKSAPKFFEDVGVKFPGYSMSYKNNMFTLKNENDDSDIIGYAFSLGSAQKLKSVPLGDVDTIFYDEFLPDDLRYSHPKDPLFEPETLLSIYLTVARGYKQVIRDDVKIICVSNVPSRYNPYFTYFGINLDGVNKHYNSKTKVVAVIDYNDSIAQEMKKSKLGYVLSNTRYGEYATGNVALHDNNTYVIDRLPKRMKYLFSIYCIQWFSVWLDLDNRLLLFRDCYDNTHKKYRLGLGGDESIPWLECEPMEMIKRHYKSDCVRYDSQKTKNVFAGIFERKLTN